MMGAALLHAKSSRQSPQHMDANAHANNIVSGALPCFIDEIEASLGKFTITQTISQEILQL